VFECFSHWAIWFSLLPQILGLFKMHVLLYSNLR
jgi:hypothetical protein